MQAEDSKWSSRKLFALCLQFIVLVVLPVVYKYFDISEVVLLTVLTATSTLTGAYLGLNVLQKKFVSPE